MGRSKELADAHWQYVEGVLEKAFGACAHGRMEEIGFHYKTAFEHGYKHGLEDAGVGEIRKSAGTGFDLVSHIKRMRSFSERTFGPQARTLGVVEHIRKELKEIEEDPCSLMEWVDVMILAIDGAWRAGFSPEQIVGALVRKQEINEKRKWPDWREFAEDKPIEHVHKEGEE